MWICRTWIKKDEEWTSEFERFETREEAEEHGKSFVQLITHDEDERCFDVYDDEVKRCLSHGMVKHLKLTEIF